MGLTCCYKTEVFYIYICSFSTTFYAISISSTCLRSRKSISKPHFDKISQSTAEIKLLMVQENKWPPYWSSISGIDFDVCVIIGVSSYICLPHFVEIGRSVAESRRHIEFSKTVAMKSEIYSRLQV